MNTFTGAVMESIADRISGHDSYASRTESPGELDKLRQRLDVLLKMTFESSETITAIGQRLFGPAPTLASSNASNDRQDRPIGLIGEIAGIIDRIEDGQRLIRVGISRLKL